MPPGWPGVRRFVFASSNAAAGDHEPPADETDLPHPVSPYGASKLAGEAYCQALRGHLRPGRLRAALLERLRPALAPQEERRRGLAAGGARRRADHDPRRRRADPRLRVRRRPGRGRRGGARRTRGRPSPASCSRPGRASRRRSTSSPRRSGRRSGDRLEIRHAAGAGRRRSAQRQPGRQGGRATRLPGDRPRWTRGSPGPPRGSRPPSPTRRWPRSCPHAASGSE